MALKTLTMTLAELAVIQGAVLDAHKAAEHAARKAFNASNRASRRGDQTERAAQWRAHVAANKLAEDYSLVLVRLSR
jgi:hypothetical protein